MARKSRKNKAVFQENEIAQGVTAKYVRISSKSEIEKATESVENQKSLLDEYIRQNQDEFSQVNTYVDIGLTGTNFERPGFEEMMNAVKAGIIKCIIVKDLSRFGRNFIETCDYIENILPFFNIRFISVTDGFDTAKSSLTDYQFLMPIKNMINEYYARDISVKERSAKKTLRKRGCFIGAHPIYGYIKDPADNHKLLIDSEAAQNVKKIFDLAEEELSDIAIAKYLNTSGIVSPAKYKFDKGIWHSEKYAKSLWYPQTVAAILKSRTYIGDMVQGVWLSDEMKGKKRLIPEEEQDTVPNMHEPIISDEQFYRVRTIRSRRHEKYLSDMGVWALNRKADDRTDNILKGKVFCSDCKTAMERTFVGDCTDKYRFFCSVYEKTGECSRKYLAEKELHSILFVLIEKRIELILGIKKLLQGKQPEQRREIEHLNDEISVLSENIQHLGRMKKALYGDWKAGVLDKKEFLFMKQHYGDKVISAQQQLETLENKKKECLERSISKNSVIESVAAIADTEVLTKDIVDLLIDRIEVYGYRQIKVYFKFEDELDGLLESLQQLDEMKSSQIA